MSTKILAIATVFILTVFLFISPAYSFNVESFNMTLTDAQKTNYTNYDVLELIFSLFNGDSQQAIFSGHSMLYLNDTNGDYWEYSSYLDLEGYSSVDCPFLDVYVNPGSSSEVSMCYIIPNDNNIGYSLILNDNRYFKDSNTKEFVLESVPDWLKSTAGSWCSDAITDSDYTNSIQFYIKQGTINVLRAQSGADIGSSIPVWVKNNACQWSNSQISDYEFLDGIYWLIDNGKIQL